MAGNFWASSHARHWLFTKAQVAEGRARLASMDHSHVDVDKLHRQLIFAIQQVGKNLRFDQIVVATGTLFFKRFLVKHTSSSSSWDARVAAISSLYLAAKVEEMGPISALDVVDRFKSVSKTFNIPFKPDTSLHEVFALERALMQHLEFDLVVFHPYSDMERFAADLSDYIGMPAQQLDLVLQLAWTITNDSQRCDCALTFPPMVIALAAIYLAAKVLAVPRAEDWFDTLNVHTQPVRECAEDMLQSSSDDKCIRM